MQTRTTENNSQKEYCPVRVALTSKKDSNSQYFFPISIEHGIETSRTILVYVQFYIDALDTKRMSSVVPLIFSNATVHISDAKYSNN